MSLTRPPTSPTTTTSGTFSLLANLIDNAIYSVLTGNHLHQWAVATIVPALASVAWYYCRTVIEITDSEQALWLRLWLGTQKSSLKRVRRLRLLSPADKNVSNNNQGFDPFGRNQHRTKENEEREDGGGRFAPPKLEFFPSYDVSTWAWFGYWLVSIRSSSPDGGGGRGSGGAVERYLSPSAGYTLTIWFAPHGTTVAKHLMLQGRQLALAKRAEKTEIWIYKRQFASNPFNIVSRPSRPLSTVIIDKGIKEELTADIKQFLNSEHWYVDKGIPYRRGILLYGPPGCGKTSLITALAGDLRLPIVFVQLNAENMDDQRIMEVLTEAPRDSIVLMEDIDCALPSSDDTPIPTPQVPPDGIPPNLPPAVQKRMMAAAAGGRRSNKIPVTLSGLLNAIDGVGAQEGRLLFMTTNHIHRLDEALIRPGRVDAKFYLGNASKAAAGQLFDQFFSSAAAAAQQQPSSMEPVDEDYSNTPPKSFSSDHVEKSRASFLNAIEDGKHSFAALQGVLMKARHDPLLVENLMLTLVERHDTRDDAGDSTPTAVNKQSTTHAAQLAEQP